MLKKVVGITIYAGVAAVLIFGAINRTLAKSGSNESRSQTVEADTHRQGGGFGTNQQLSQPGFSNQPGYSQQPLNNGEPLAQVDSWVSVEGAVNSADQSLVLVTLADGETVEIAGRTWSFAQENGFSVLAGDRLRLTGFYENAALEVGSIENLTSGLSIQVRDQNGRPLWAGRGREG